MNGETGAVADQTNSTSRMAIEDIARIGAEGSDAAVLRAHDDNQMIAVIVTMASEPYDFGHLFDSGNGRRASEELQSRDDGHT